MLTTCISQLQQNDHGLQWQTNGEIAQESDRNLCSTKVVTTRFWRLWYYFVQMTADLGVTESATTKTKPEKLSVKDDWSKRHSVKTGWRGKWKCARRTSMWSSRHQITVVIDHSINNSCCYRLEWIQQDWTAVYRYCFFFSPMTTIDWNSLDQEILAVTQ